jgi:polyphosphate kinase
MPPIRRPVVVLPRRGAAGADALAIDTSRPFPLLASLTLNLAIILDPESEDAEPRLAIVQVPRDWRGLLRILAAGKSFVLLEDVIRANLFTLFPGQTIREVRCIRLSRDAELELEDEGARTHLEIVERQLKQRRQSDVVRLEIEAARRRRWSRCSSPASTSTPTTCTRCRVRSTSGC